MNYSKLRNKFKKEVSNKPEFFASIGMSSSGFYSMLKEETLKVKILEAISDALNVSPGYWWQEEDAQLNMVNETHTPYGGFIPRSVYTELVSKWNEDRESKNKLEDQLTEVLKLLCSEKNKKAC
jgi:DNA-binding Xre family transcriptional regulator